MKFKYTQSVDIRRNVNADVDPFGSNKTDTDYEVERVDNCVVVPKGGSAVVDTNRPDGFKVLATLHLPKTYKKPLTGAEVYVQGQWLKVAGDTLSYPDNCPTEWNRNVELGVTNG